MEHVLEMDVETIKRFIQTVPLGVVNQFKLTCDNNPTNEKVIAVRELVIQRLGL